MENQNHVVLGGNGVTGTETIKALGSRGVNAISVGRRSHPDRAVRSHIADLLDPDQAARALAGAEVAYLTVGLPHSAKSWQERWPLILGNTVDAATKTGTHLVYLDNVYAYGKVDGPMTEQVRIRPSSKKGQVRAEALGMLGSAARERGLSYSIARSSDFYGPGASMSVFNMFAIEPVAKGKKGSWTFNANVPHSLTYTPDIGQALATLGTDPRGRSGTWHIPTAPALTGRQCLEILAGPGVGTKVMSQMYMRIGGLFNEAARETLEMAYQYTCPHILDSHLFESTFGVAPTPKEEGIAQTLRAARAELRELDATGA